ncbi:MAG: GreA/GreB family elongation factor [Hahellaceae bacterium]|nr:GreA/GreB family elongation factor [Hahellaceae bacterium]
MTKLQLFQLILAKLRDDLEMAKTAALTAYEAATHEESIAENKYDTLGLEASYLAAGQSRRVHELENALTACQNLTLAHFETHSPIQLSALIELEDAQGKTRWLFIAPDAAGLKVHDGIKEVLVISPQSPMGQALKGKFCGEEVKLYHSQGTSQFTIINIY